MRKLATKENIFSVVIALVLSFVVFLGVQNSALLTADIAGTQVEFSDDSDLISYIEGEKLIIASNKAFPDAINISMLLSYNPETVKIERHSIETNYELSYADSDPGRSTLGIAGDFGSLSQGDILLVFDLIGDLRDMVVSDIIIEFKDGTSDRLSFEIK